MSALYGELIYNILGNFGLYPEFKNGISESKFKIDKTIDIKFDDGENKRYNVFVTTVNCELPFNAICTLMNNDLFLVFWLEGSGYYGVSLDYKNNFCDIIVKDTDRWRTMSIYERLLICACIERISQSTNPWEVCDDYSKQFKILSEFIENST